MFMMLLYFAFAQSVEHNVHLTCVVNKLAYRTY